MGAMQQHEMNGFHHLPGGLDHVSFLLGRIMSKQDETHNDVAEIKVALRDGAEIHADLKQRVATLETAKERPPPLEVWLKYAATLALPLATLWATGSVEKALSVYEKIRAVAGH